MRNLVFGMVVSFIHPFGMGYLAVSVFSEKVGFVVSAERGSESATVRRWQLTETLRKLREEAGLTLEQAAYELRKGPGRWSKPTLSRIENREQGVKPTAVLQILDAYKIADPELRAHLVDLAQSASARGWWSSVRRNLPESFRPVLDLELALVAKRQYETLIVPGLLQTAEYTRAVINGIEPGLPVEEVERRIGARMARQQILAKPNPPRFHAILDENILERPIGGPSVMRAQLRRLLDASDAANITVQIVPKSVGATPGIAGPFSILTLPDPIPDIGYAEGSGRSLYVEDREQVRTYTFRFGILTERALSPQGSAARINQALKDL